MALSRKQQQAIHARKWNRMSEEQRQKIMTRHGFGQSAGIRGTMSPLVKRKYEQLPREFKLTMVGDL